MGPVVSLWYQPDAEAGTYRAEIFMRAPDHPWVVVYRVQLSLILVMLHAAPLERPPSPLDQATCGPARQASFSTLVAVRALRQGQALPRAAVP